MASPLRIKHRFLGDSGLLVSRFALGGWVNNNGDADVDRAYDIFVRGFEHGVNVWDTAEAYGAGASEKVVGRVLQRGIENGVWTREDIVISTKIFEGTRAGPNNVGLSRKHLIEGAKASLKRLGVDYVDVIFCHHSEKYTPIEEIVRAMNFIINQGWAFYWGTSNWQAQDILTACEIADRLGLIRPIVEQPMYNLVQRSTVEVDFQTLYQKYKLGLTTFSPLAFGLLTGKYANGIPSDSRFSDELYRYIFSLIIGDADELIGKVEKLRPIAEELGCSLAQLALAWAASNEHVSTVILGAKTVEQLDENLKAFAFVDKLTPEIKAKIDAALPFEYRAPTRGGFFEARGRHL